MGSQPDTDDSPGKTVIVLGGGLAGLSAARCLIERGYHVILAEKRSFLGGRAFSFHDPQAGCEIDNGQHVFMGCCTYYLDFLRDLEVLDKTYMQSRLRAEVVLNGKSGVLSSAPGLGPFHLLPSFLLYPHLGPIDKIRVLYGLLRAKLTDRRKGRDGLESQTFAEWLRHHHQTDRAIKSFWSLIIVPTLNDDVHDVSANMALMVIQDGLLSRPVDATIGFARVGLTSLTGEPGQRFIEERGGELLLGRSVSRLRVEHGRCTGVELSDGSLLQADAYVSALPFDVLLQVLPEEVIEGSELSAAARLKSSPIVGIHLWYDRPIMDQDFVAFLDSPVQWVFNRSRIQNGNGQGGQYVCISLSGAWDYVDRPKEELRETFAREMERLFPRCRGAHIERSLIIKQPKATFRCLPGAADLRPSQSTSIQDLFLAGEWTDTGWPSTMEGAVRSGVFAADAVAADTR